MGDERPDQRRPAAPASAPRRRSGGSRPTWRGLTGHLPAGAQVCSAWEGDRLKLDVGVLGQSVEAAIDVRETLVHVTVLLPPALAFFGKAIEAGLRRGAPALLEDRTKRG